MPSQRLVAYSAKHVNTLFSMLKRHSNIAFEPVCITDDPNGIDADVRVLPLWDKCLFLRGCFNRLYVFSNDMARYIGPRFLCIDMDCVITGDVTDILKRPEPFVMNSYQSGGEIKASDQVYNGSMIMMDAGARSEVWDDFDFQESPQRVFNRNDRIGTDQAWIRERLGPDEARFTPEEGVLEARCIGATLPAGARIVFFSGKRDPSTTGHWGWVRENYR